MQVKDDYDSKQKKFLSDCLFDYGNKVDVRLDKQQTCRDGRKTKTKHTINLFIKNTMPM